MAEVHKKVTGIDSVEKVMLELYRFVKEPAKDAGIVRFVGNTHTGSVWDGAAFASDADNPLTGSSTGAGWFGTGSYIVVEPVDRYPGMDDNYSGSRWSAKFLMVPGTDDLLVQLATIGHWNHSTGKFTNDTPKTNEERWNDGGNPSGNGALYISACNSDTYNNGDANYSYIRLLIGEMNNSESNIFLEAAYVGGYIPADATNNTKPVCMLVRDPEGTTSNSTWAATSNNKAYVHNRCNNENDHSTIDLYESGLCRILKTDTYDDGATNATHTGQWVNYPSYLINTTQGCVMGWFGKHTHLTGHINRTDRLQDSDEEYMVVNDLMFRFKP